MKKNIYKIGILIAFLAILFLVGSIGNQENVYAGVGETKLKGYAWSDNIGWISFSCTNTDSCGSVNYNVSIASGGEMSGYAWSDNIGWISFNSSDVENCSSGTCTPNFTGSNIEGWAKAISADDAGWDGFISLNGPDYGVTYNSENKNFEGYAWGSDVVGWISFKPDSSDEDGGGGGDGGGGEDDDGDDDDDGGVEIDPDLSEPIVNLDAFPTSVVSGENTRLFWTNENVASCEASGGPWSGNWSDSESVEGEVQDIGPINSDTEFSMTCLNAVGDDTTGSVTVTLLPADFSLSKSGNVELSGVKGTSTPSTVTIIPVNNFNSNISLSIVSMSPELSEAGTELSVNSLTSSEYGSGSEFRIIVNDPVSSGLYFVTIQGVGGGLTRTIDINLEVDSEDIEFEEF